MTTLFANTYLDEYGYTSVLISLKVSILSFLCVDVVSVLQDSTGKYDGNENKYLVSLSFNTKLCVLSYLVTSITSDHLNEPLNS